MNIILSLKKSQLNAVVEILQAANITKPEGIAEKCMFYLYTSCLKKLLRKQIDKADVFSNKPFKISLKYEEATALLMELDKVLYTHNYYVAIAIIAVKNVLHQKLTA